MRVLSLIEMFLDCGNEFVCSGYLTADCLFKIATFGGNCSGQPDFQIDAKKQYSTQKRR